MFFCAASNPTIHSVPMQHRQFPTCFVKRNAVFFCPQNIAEFWNVATRPADKNGLGLSHEEVRQEVSSIESMLTLLPESPAIYPTWKAIVNDHKVRGVKVHDARLAAIMAVYSVESILTFNDADFKRYTKIKAIHPSSIVA